jgi:putative spermidine/putrescine transport system permease protein
MGGEGTEGVVKRRSVLLYLLPLLVPFVLLFLGGSTFALLQSFGFLSPIPIEAGPFDAYRRLLSNPWFYRSFGFSLYVGFVSASVSTAIGTVLAYLIWGLPLKTQRYSIIYKIPLILPHIAVAFIVLILFSRSGILSSILYNAGLTQSQQDFPSILFGGNGLGIIIAYIFKEVPFVVLLVSGILKKFDPRHIHTAVMLGASRTSIFFRIVVPFLMPVINTTFIILFLYSFGAFDIPYILSESRPEMLSIYVFNLYFKRDLINRPYAMAVLVMMLAFSTLFIFGYTRLVSRLGAEERKL